MPDDIDPGHRTPVWLWVLSAFGLAVFGTGSFLARVEHHLYDVLILAVGLAIVLTFVVLRGRHAGERQ